MKTITRLSLLLVAVLFLAGCPPRQHLAASVDPQLSVRGEGRVKVKPDQVEMVLEAQTTAESAEAALSENSAVIEDLYQRLRAVGLGEKEYQTGQFSIQPQWSRPPRPAPANWKPEIVGYRVNNSIHVATTRVAMAGQLLAMAQQAGVHRAGQLRFSLADPEAASREAIALATQRARQRAEVLAGATGVKLGRLIEARVEEGGAGPQPMLMMAEAASTRKAGPVPISAGEVEVRAAVVLRYAIGN